MSPIRVLFTTVSAVCLVSFAAEAQVPPPSPQGAAIPAPGMMQAPAGDNAPITHAEFKALLEKTLMEHPEIIMQAAQKYQSKQADELQKQASAALVQHKAEIYNDTTSPAVGNPNAEVTVVEFFDYHCGYCKHLMPDIAKLLAEDKNVRVLFREFPILSPDSISASRAALAVYRIAPDKYFDYHQALMKSNGKFDEKLLLDTAKSLGVNAAKLKAEMGKKEISDMLDKTRELAESIGITGTPALIIGDNLFPGALPYDAIKKAVDEVHEAKKASAAAPAVAKP